MLPTVLVIIWAYLIYALWYAFSRRRYGSWEGRCRWRRLKWLAMMASSALGLGLLGWLALSPKAEHRGLTLAGFMGTVWAEGWPDKVDAKVEYPPLKDQSGGGQPVYALLHPETPQAAMAPKKTGPKPKPVRKGKLQKAPTASVKVAKAAPLPAKKDKSAQKNRTKKKKRTASTAGRRPAGG